MGEEDVGPTKAKVAPLTPSYETMCRDVVLKCAFLIVGVKAAISGTFCVQHSTDIHFITFEVSFPWVSPNTLFCYRLTCVRLEMK